MAHTPRCWMKLRRTGWRELASQLASQSPPRTDLAVPSQMRSADLAIHLRSACVLFPPGIRCPRPPDSTPESRTNESIARHGRFCPGRISTTNSENPHFISACRTRCQVQFLLRTLIRNQAISFSHARSPEQQSAPEFLRPRNRSSVGGETEFAGLKVTRRR